MRRLFDISIGILALAAPLFIAGQAQATDTRSAIRMCDNNPNCDYNVTDDGVTIWVSDGNGGTTFVDCPVPGQPGNGQCTAVRTSRAFQTNNIGKYIAAPVSAVSAGGGDDEARAPAGNAAPLAKSKK